MQYAINSKHVRVIRHNPTPCEHVSPVHPGGQEQLLGPTHIPPLPQLGWHTAGGGEGEGLVMDRTMELSMEYGHVLTNVTTAPSPPVDTGALLRGHTSASISTHRTAHS